MVIGVFTANEEQGLYEALRWADVQFDLIFSSKPYIGMEVRAVLDKLVARVQALGEMTAQHSVELNHLLSLIEESKTGSQSLDDVRAALFVAIGLFSANEERWLYEALKMADGQLDLILANEKDQDGLTEAQKIIGLVAARIRAELGKERGTLIAEDPQAISASEGKPAFIAPPPGAPVYHGFVTLEDITFDGFTLGMIPDFEDDPEYGDAFIIAPDNSRAGLAWQVYADKPGVTEISPLEPGRWGVWSVNFPNP